MIAGDKDTYLTLEGPCEGLFKAKGSKHFGYGFPVHSEAEVKGHSEAIRKSHHAARHRLRLDDWVHRRPLQVQRRRGAKQQRRAAHPGGEFGRMN